MVHRDLERLSTQCQSHEGSVALASGRRAVVVFEDRSDCSLLRLLRPGFRHCFCLVGAAKTWTLCDPLMTRIEIQPVPGLSEHEIARGLAAPGRTVLLGEVVGEPFRHPVRLRAITCVEVVKRVLNIDAAGAFTPFQLCRALLHPYPPSRPFLRYAPVENTLDSIQI